MSGENSLTSSPSPKHEDSAPLPGGSHWRDYYPLALELAELVPWVIHYPGYCVPISDGIRALLGDPTLPDVCDLPTLLHYVHPDDRDAAQSALGETLASGQERLHELRVVWPDGSLHWIELRGRALRDST